MCRTLFLRSGWRQFVVVRPAPRVWATPVADSRSSVRIHRLGVGDVLVGWWAPFRRCRRRPHGSRGGRHRRRRVGCWRGPRRPGLFGVPRLAACRGVLGRGRSSVVDSFGARRSWHARRADEASEGQEGDSTVRRHAVRRVLEPVCGWRCSPSGRWRSHGAFTAHVHDGCLHSGGSSRGCGGRVPCHALSGRRRGKAASPPPSGFGPRQ